MLRNTTDGFGLLARLFHWTAAACFIGAYIFIYYVLWFLDEPRRPTFATYINIHWVRRDQVLTRMWSEPSRAATTIASSALTEGKSPIS